MAWRDDFTDTCGTDPNAHCAPDPDKWTVVDSQHPTSKDAEQETFQAANVYVEKDNHLVLRASTGTCRDASGNSYECIASGAIRTGYTSLSPTGDAGFGFGRIDITGWLPRGVFAVTPALWMANPLCRADGSGPNPEDPSNSGCGKDTWPFEIDLAEFRGTDTDHRVSYFSRLNGDWGGCGPDGNSCPYNPMYNVVSATYPMLDPNPDDPAESSLWEKHTFSVTRRPSESFRTTRDSSSVFGFEGKAMRLAVERGIPMGPAPTRPSSTASSRAKTSGMARCTSWSSSKMKRETPSARRLPRWPRSCRS